MIHNMNKKQMCLAVSCALALGVTCAAARAQTDVTQNQYLTDQRGGVVMSGYGLCWRSDYGPPPASTAECDPNFVAPKSAAMEPAPEPVAETMPEPVAVVEAPQAAPIPVPSRSSLDADTLFDFDKSELRPAGRLALDDFVARIHAIHPEMIMAAGYTDRLGTDDYNQRLSERRVLAVKTYLVSLGIEPDRVQIQGRGEADPITKAGDCLGAESASVIACLQPDRRVEIEVKGMQVAM